MSGVTIRHSARSTASAWLTVDDMTACEWEDCQDTATHTVEITFPDADDEIWQVCRSHDRLLKLQAVRSRPKTVPKEDAPPLMSVQCGQCQRLLREPAGLTEEDRQPCPACGSVTRHVNVMVSDTATAHESLRIRSKQAGKGGWRVDTLTGDDYTRDLKAWGKRELTMNRDVDLYREVIEIHDGTRITSTARLRDHQG
jgi:hypothetical protein